ncbi:MAG: hypothetical protein ACLR9K_12545 [Blautia sp.]
MENCKDIAGHGFFGILTFGGFNVSNWHKKNLDETLKALENINK